MAQCAVAHLGHVAGAGDSHAEKLRLDGCSWRLILEDDRFGTEGDGAGYIVGISVQVAILDELRRRSIRGGLANSVAAGLRTIPHYLSRITSKPDQAARPDCAG